MEAHKEAERKPAEVPHTQSLCCDSDPDTKLRQTYSEKNGPSPFDVFLCETQRVKLSILTFEADYKGGVNIHSATNQQHDREDIYDEDDDDITVTLPTKAEIKLLGRQVQFKNLTLLVSNICFLDTRSEIIGIFKTFGCLRNIHMPCYRSDQPESHRGFAMFTFIAMDGVRAALQSYHAQADEPRHFSWRIRRLTDHSIYEKYCKGIDVAAIMSSNSQVASSRKNLITVTAATPRERTEKRKACSSNDRTGTHVSITREEHHAQKHVFREESLPRQVSRRSKINLKKNRKKWNLYIKLIRTKESSVSTE